LRLRAPRPFGRARTISSPWLAQTPARAGPGCRALRPRPLHGPGLRPSGLVSARFRLRPSGYGGLRSGLPFQTAPRPTGPPWVGPHRLASLARGRLP
jgi:hypothetical protein